MPVDPRQQARYNLLRKQGKSAEEAKAMVMGDQAGEMPWPVAVALRGGGAYGANLLDEVAGIGGGVWGALGAAAQLKNPVTGAAEGYNRTRDAVLRDMDTARERLGPVGTAATEFVGGVVSPVNKLMKFKKLGEATSTAGKVLTAAENTARAAAPGVVYGFGSGDGLEDRISRAETGGVVSAGLTGGLKGLGWGGKQAWQLGRKVKSTFFPSAEETALKGATLAHDIVGRDIVPGGTGPRSAPPRALTPGALAQRSREATQDGVDDMIVAELGGENAINSIRGASRLGGPLQERMRQFFRGRALENPGDVADEMVQAVGVQPKWSAPATQQILRDRAATAKVMYDEARQVKVEDEAVATTLKGFLDDPVTGRWFGKLWEEAKALAKHDGFPVEEQITTGALQRMRVADLPDDVQRSLFSQGFTPDQVITYHPKNVALTPTVSALDYLKRGVGPRIRQLINGEGMDPRQGSILKQQIDHLLTQVDAAVPEYAAARAEFARSSRLVDAIETAEKLAPIVGSSRGGVAREVRATLKAMNPEQREVFRAIMLDRLVERTKAIRNEFGQTIPDVTAKTTNREQAEVIRALTTSVDKADLFGRQQALRQAQERAKQIGLSVGSRTSEDLAAMLQGPSRVDEYAAASAASGSPGLALRHFLMSGVDRARRSADEKTVGEATKLMLGGMPGFGSRGQSILRIAQGPRAYAALKAAQQGRIDRGMSAFDRIGTRGLMGLLASSMSPP